MVNSTQKMLMAMLTLLWLECLSTASASCGTDDFKHYYDCLQAQKRREWTSKDNGHDVLVKTQKRIKDCLRKNGCPAPNFDKHYPDMSGIGLPAEVRRAIGNVQDNFWYMNPQSFQQCMLSDTVSNFQKHIGKCVRDAGLPHFGYPRQITVQMPSDDVYKANDSAVRQIMNNKCLATTLVNLCPEDARERTMFCITEDDDGGVKECVRKHLCKSCGHDFENMCRAVRKCMNTVIDDIWLNFSIMDEKEKNDIIARLTTCEKQTRRQEDPKFRYSREKALKLYKPIFAVFSAGSGERYRRALKDTAQAYVDIDSYCALTCN